MFFHKSVQVVPVSLEASDAMAGGGLVGVRNLYYGGEQ